MMKANFSKYWHFFYCAVIAVLGYFYYDATCSQAHYDSIFETRNALRRSNESLEQTTGNLLNDIEKVAYGDGNKDNKQVIQASKNIFEIYQKGNDFINKTSQALITHYGGLNIQFIDGRMVNYKGSIFQSNFFNRQKINELRNKIAQVEEKKIETINTLDERFKTDFSYQPIIADSTFWLQLETENPAMALLKLEELKSFLLSNNISSLKNLLNKVGHTCLIFDRFELALLTEQINVKNQDFFEGYVTLVKHSPFECQSRDLEYFANGKKLKATSNGIYLKYKPEKVGKNKINLSCKIRNPLTGAVIEAKSVKYFYSK